MPGSGSNAMPTSVIGTRKLHAGTATGLNFSSVPSGSTTVTIGLPTGSTHQLPNRPCDW